MGRERGCEGGREGDGDCQPAVVSDGPRPPAVFLRRTCPFPSMASSAITECRSRHPLCPCGRPSRRSVSPAQSERLLHSATQRRRTQCPPRLLRRHTPCPVLAFATPSPVQTQMASRCPWSSAQPHEDPKIPSKSEHRSSLVLQSPFSADPALLGQCAARIVSIDSPPSPPMTHSHSSRSIARS